MIDALRTYLLANSVAQTIYIGFMPPQPNNAITLFETAGMPPDAKYQYNTMGLQVMTRASDYDSAREIAWAAYDKLQSFATSTQIQTISGFSVTQILAEQDPYAMGNDDLGRAQFVQNYLVYYETQLGFRR